MANRSSIPSSLNDGSSYFHMLQVRMEKRFSHGLELLGNYQYSKLMEKRSRLNNSDAFLEKRIASEDRPQRFVLSASYDLPFGRGRTFGGHVHPVVNKIIGGWVINAIYTVQPGAPLTWGNVMYFGGDLQMNTRNIDRMFDTTRFNTNSAQQLGSNIRTFPSRFANLRADGANNLDASVLKNFGITEKMNLQYRFEAFNATNRAQFDPPELNAVATNFGASLFQSNLPRRIQMALRLTW